MNLRIKLGRNLISLLKSQAFLASILGLALLASQVAAPKEVAQGNATIDQTAGVWSGTLGPEPYGSDVSSVSNVSVALNPSNGQYEAGLSGTNLSGNLRSTVIAPNLISFNKWKQVKFGFRRPAGTTTTMTFSILCGDSGQCTPGQALYVNGVQQLNLPVPVNDQYDIPGDIVNPLGTKVSAITVQVNFSRNDTTNPITVLYDWQVNWEVNSGVSVTVSKTPNPANPESFQAAYTGVPNNFQVTYRLSYSLRRSVDNFTLELPLPAGTYTSPSGGSKNYTSSHVGGGTLSGNRVVWNLGNVPNNTTGFVEATVKINPGPPDGTIFETSARVSGSNYAAVTLPADSLNIKSQGVIHSNLMGPEFVAASLTTIPTPIHNDVDYIILMDNTDLNHQSDVFNARYEFWYSPCMNDSIAPVITGSGATSTSTNTTNFASGGVNYGGRIIFNMPSPLQMSTPPMTYGVRMRAADASCQADDSNVVGRLEIFSTQDSTLTYQKFDTLTFNNGTPPKWDRSPSVELDYFKDGAPSLVGSSQRFTYNLRLLQHSSMPVADFYMLDKLPANTTFLNANIARGELAKIGAFGAQWRIYYSTYTGPDPVPRGAHSGGWTELAGGPAPCSLSTGCYASPPPGQKITWIKWDLGGTALRWDRQGNYDPVIGSLTVVSDASISGNVVNSMRAFSGGTCLTRSPNTTCPEFASSSSDNKPHFFTNFRNCTTRYDNCDNNPAVVTVGSSYYVLVDVANTHTTADSSRGNATNVRVRIRLPDRIYQTLDLSPTETYARCDYGNNDFRQYCPDSSGIVNNSQPAPWLTSFQANDCNGSLGNTCELEWSAIPIIYSSLNYPAQQPTAYRFFIKLDVKTGLLKDQTLCNNQCRVTVSSTPAPSNTNFPFISPNEVRVTGQAALTLEKSAGTTLSYQGVTRFTISYKNLPPSNLAVPSVTIIDSLPENGGYVPPPRLIIDPANMPVAGPSTTIRYMAASPSYPRNYATPPPANDPNWKTQAEIAGIENLVDWVKWEIADQVDVGEIGTVELPLKDSGSPSGTSFENRAFMTFPGAPSSLPVATGTVTVQNPGFATTTQGNVGSVGKLGSSFLPPSSECVPNDTNTTNGLQNQCNTQYLGIANEIVEKLVDHDENTATPPQFVTFFTSFKDWLVSDYDFSTDTTDLSSRTDYDNMWQEYQQEAVECDGQRNCLDTLVQPNTRKVKVYRNSNGDPLQINLLTQFRGVPLILFVDGSLEINAPIQTSFAGSESGIIFVVKEDVRVHHSVNELDGVFLVDGQFSTGRRSETINSPNAGQHAAISVGRDGFSRIVYLAGSSVRFIKCLDINCTNRTYELLGSAENVTNISMILREKADGKDYPTVVIGKRTPENIPSTELISCQRDDCFDLNRQNFNYNDPDIASEQTASGNSYYLSHGWGPTLPPRGSALSGCSDSPCNPNTTVIESPSFADKGNETNAHFDPVSRLAMGTYVDRSSGKSDLWMTRQVGVGTGSGCSGTVNYSCKLLSSSPGNVGPYPSSVWINNSLRTTYQDSVTKEIKNINCYTQDCASPVVSTIDCSTNCLGQRHLSSAANGSLHTVLYNVTVDVGGGILHNEVRLKQCFVILDCEGFGWSAEKKLSNTSGIYQTEKGFSYTQSLALGRAVEIGAPRVVFYDEILKGLVYIRCTSQDCNALAPAVVLDTGLATALKDRKLNINGAVYAYGTGVSSGQAINLERDLFGDSRFLPAETFALQPRYFYIFRDTIKGRSVTREAPP